MKIDLQAVRNDTNFMVHEHFIGDTPVYLVQPVHIGAAWSANNLIFRSSVWTADGDPVSLSFKKFANFGEKPEVFPVPTSLNGCKLMEKIDGSALIVSHFASCVQGESTMKHHQVIRTRGTVDATKQDNGAEIEILKQKYPLAFNNSLLLGGGWSLVFEWCSPTNKIVLDYGPEPLLYLTAIISHHDYSYLPQHTLDDLAEDWGVLRPRHYKFDTIDEMLKSMEAFKGAEGICVYYGDGQEITKVKGAQYLMLHRMKSDVGSIEKVMDLWFSQGQPQYQDFMDFLEKTFDYEIMVMARGHVSKICGAWKEVEKILHGMRGFLLPMTMMGEPRKIIAQKVLQAYGETSRSSMVFAILDKKPLTVDQKKKLLFQCLK